MSSMIAPRRDALPENAEYVDSGCSEAPSCLAWPLPQCRYDAPSPRLHAARDAEIRRLHAEGDRAEVLAKRFGVSKRTVFRVLKEVAR